MAVGRRPMTLSEALAHTAGNLEGAARELRNLLAMGQGVATG